MKTFLTYIFISSLYSISFLTSPIASATLITVDDWHLTTDNAGGLRQSAASEDVYYAVSKLTTFNSSLTFEAINGYHFATFSEWASLVDSGSNNGYSYYNQEGWSGYNWAGVNRRYFLFSDSVITTRLKHAGQYDTVSTTRNLVDGFREIAGFVMVKNQQPKLSAFAVPEPTTFSILTLSLLGLVIYRKNKSRTQ